MQVESWFELAGCGFQKGSEPWNKLEKILVSLTVSYQNSKSSQSSKPLRWCRFGEIKVPPRPAKEEPTPFPREPIFPPAALWEPW